MESDSLNYDNMESDITQQPRLDLLNPGNLFQSAWIRRSIRNSNEVDGFLLGYGFNFLLPISILLWAIFFIA